MTEKDKPQLINYIKLDDILYNTVKELNKLDFVKTKYTPNTSIELKGNALNCLLANGYYDILYSNATDDIKLNFDYTGTNSNVVLDYNSEFLKKLLKTETVTGAKQETLIWKKSKSEKEVKAGVICASVTISEITPNQ